MRHERYDIHPDLGVRGDFRAQLKDPRHAQDNAEEQQRKAPSNNSSTKVGLKIRLLLHPTILKQTSALKLDRRLLEGEFELEEK